MKNPKKESFKNKQLRCQKIIKLLKKYIPRPRCALNHKNPLQLLIATILSAQCTDKRVNEVTKTLFKKYKTTRDFATASLKNLSSDIYSTGFFKTKAENIKKATTTLVKDFKGKVPDTFEDLIKLSGVGRKTAHVVMGTAFQVASGVVVDTHVKRLSGRLGFTRASQPEKVEKDLTALLPPEEWIYFSHALIWHGRGVCKARKPLCNTCFLEELCPGKQT